MAFTGRKERLTPRTVAYLDPLKGARRATNKPHVLLVHDSITAMIEYAETACKDGDLDDARRGHLRTMGSGNFTGHTSRRQCAEWLLHGNEELAKRSAALLSQFNAVTVPSQVTRRISSPVGGRVCVPAMLSGSPVAMRRRKVVNDHAAPLDIVFNAVSSAGVDRAALERVGIAVAAMVQKLSATRQINLYVAYTALAGSSPVTALNLVKVPTTPVNPRRLAFMLSDQIFPRVFAFAAYAKAGEDYAALSKTKQRTNNSQYVAWPFDDSRYIDQIGDDLRAMWGNEMLYIKGAYLDQQAKLGSDPVGWIKGIMAQYG